MTQDIKKLQNVEKLIKVSTNRTEQK